MNEADARFIRHSIKAYGTIMEWSDTGVNDLVAKFDLLLAVRDAARELVDGVGMEAGQGDAGISIQWVPYLHRIKSALKALEGK
jgi:hypothetical protein